MTLWSRMEVGQYSFKGNKMGKRAEHFEKAIRNGKTYNLSVLTGNVFNSSNFLCPNTKTLEQCRIEVAKSQEGFVEYLEKGDTVHLAAGVGENIIVGVVEEVDDFTLKLEGKKEVFNLSEVQTITGQ